MTTGFQHQHQGYGSVFKSAAKPQHIGAKLADLKSKPDPAPEPRAGAEPKSFRSTRRER